MYTHVDAMHLYTAPLIDGMGNAVELIMSWSLANSSESVTYVVYIRHCDTQHSPSIVTLNASTVRKQAECGRGKPVVLAYWLGFSNQNFRMQYFYGNRLF